MFRLAPRKPSTLPLLLLLLVAATALTMLGFGAHGRRRATK